MIDDEPHPENVHHGTERDGQEHHDNQGDFVPRQRLFLKIVNQLRVAIADQNADLEHETAQKERDEHDDCVDRVANCSMLFVRVEQPSKRDVGRRHLDEKQNDSEDYGPVHEGQSAHECDKRDDMVANHLLVNRGKIANNENNTDCISDEIAACVDQCPYMQVSRSSHAVIIIKDSLTATTHFKHGQGGKHDANNRMNWTDKIGSIVTLF